MREFQLLRSQLYRDQNVISDVWLQTAKPGADQEAQNVLFDFPSTRAQMDSYDCVVAFDPDWRQLSNEQAELLERWVSEKAGGLILVAGPVMTPRWTASTDEQGAIERIKRLYPVAFYRVDAAVLKVGRFGGSQPFPLQFTKAGLAADYLRLSREGHPEEDAWSDFPGVFGYYAVNEPKAGAEVLARFADANTAISGELPIYLATQFYGSGRVFFQASGEMWRLRELSVDYFEQYYIRLIQYVSQGRLLRDSSRGVLLVDRPRGWIGEPVTVRATLRDLRDEPYQATAIDATLIGPNGDAQPLRLTGIDDPSQAGSFSAQFTPRSSGEYRVALPVPDSPEAEVLKALFRADVPDLERQNPQRNDELLQSIAERTGGHYFRGFAAIRAPNENRASLTQLIPPQDQEIVILSNADRRFASTLMQWLLGVFTLTLTLEWLSRRLNKLA